MNNTLRIYSKNGVVKALPSQLNEEHLILLNDGWVHTSTIDPIMWIECLCNGYGQNIDSMIDELHMGAELQPQS
jgi:hypothetical protein